MHKDSPVIAIVVPCYKEEEVFTSSDTRLRSLLEGMERDGLVAPESRIVYVDDGSSDATWQLISEACAKYPDFDAGVKLGHNVGHQNALVAGMEMVKDWCDAVITIDADLQDDINVIPEMIRKFKAGNEIVYGVRASRKTDTWFKRNSAKGFYLFMKKMGVNTLYNHADFRLMSSRAVSELLKYKETNIFLRGIVPRIGLKHTTLSYNRKAREMGESKYPVKKMVNFAVEGITSFSIKPVRFVFFLGIIFVCISAVIFIYTLYRYMRHEVIEGWTSLMLSVWFCAGVILLALGIIGEYVGKIFLEVKERPRFVIEHTLGLPKTN